MKVPDADVQEYYVDKLVVTDTLPDGAEFVKFVSTPSGFTCKNSGKNLTMTASTPNQESFQGQTYSFVIKVKHVLSEITPTTENGKTVYPTENHALLTYSLANSTSEKTKKTSLVTSIYENQLASVTIRKLDDSGNPLGGVPFQLNDSEGNNEAEAVENAKKMAETCELPQNGEYLEDSFEIDEEGRPIPVL